MKIGVISDTHGFLDPKVPEIFAGVSHILHAGDMGGDSIIVELGAIAPVTAVLGNTDSSPAFRLTEVVTLAGRKFLVHHIVNPHALKEELQLRDGARATGCRRVRPHPQGFFRNDWRRAVFESRLRRQTEVWRGSHRGDPVLRREGNPAGVSAAIAVHIVIGAQEFTRKSREHFVFWQSARGLAQSKTLRVAEECQNVRQVLDCGCPPPLFSRGISNCAKDSWNCHIKVN